MSWLELAIGVAIDKADRCLIRSARTALDGDPVKLEAMRDRIRRRLP